MYHRSNRILRKKLRRLEAKLRKQSLQSLDMFQNMKQAACRPIKEITSKIDRKNVQREEICFMVADPDIRKNDGIYSRYFTNYQRSGKYGVEVLILTSFADRPIT